VKNGIAGVVAQCGGACSCATCHVYVDEIWVQRLPPPTSIETDMLECAWEPRPNSRLSCQVVLNDSLNGLRVHVPERQG
jgi:2Fe-2S ferredoxin